MGEQVQRRIRVWVEKVAFICASLFLLAEMGHTSNSPKVTEMCEYYDDNPSQETFNKTFLRNGTRFERCDAPEPGKRAHCYALWKNESGNVVVMKKGCWLNDETCFDKADCERHSDPRKDNVEFCCCDGSACNNKFISYQTDQEPLSATPTPLTPSAGSQLLQTLLYSLVPIAGITVIIILMFFIWRRHKINYHHQQLPTTDPSPLPRDSPLLGQVRPLQLLEVKARGRYGCVWKAQMMQELVAVKIFPPQDKQSWAVEKDLYCLPLMNTHENILRFIGAETRGDNLNMELWLITEFHEKGSLYDYLKGNLITYSELLKLSESLARGMAFLHEDIPATKGNEHKVAVAHRDFKSRNVLVRNNLTACIADFGLALKFEPRKCVGDTHGQVGTRRYMAPEVLEGAINFNRDAFLRIDMYSVGLVMWEMVSRCSSVDGPVDEYQFPFEDEVGQHPTLEDMQDVVIHKKLRPQLKEHWYKHAGIAAMLDTIEECWDHDPEARLSAGCVEERLSQLSQQVSIPIVPSVIVTSNQETPPKESSI